MQEQWLICSKVKKPLFFAFSSSRKLTSPEQHASERKGGFNYSERRNYLHAKRRDLNVWSSYLITQMIRKISSRKTIQLRFLTVTSKQTARVPAFTRKLAPRPRKNLPIISTAPWMNRIQEKTAAILRSSSMGLSSPSRSHSRRRTRTLSCSQSSKPWSASVLLGRRTRHPTRPAVPNRTPVGRAPAPRSVASQSESRRRRRRRPSQ